MKKYPSIDSSKNAQIGEKCVVFNKLDGSNLCFSWDKKKGWHTQGTRHRLFDKSDPDFGQAIDIFQNKYKNLAKAVLDFRKCDSFIAFAEFLGPYSFAGIHDSEKLRTFGITQDNNPKDVVLFDVNVNKKGFIGPENFLRLFGHLHIPEVIYQGVLTEEFVEGIRKNGKGEGVVCKSGDGFDHTLKMCKIKTYAYIQLLKERFGVGWGNYGE